jgi:hypothetical protein
LRLINIGPAGNGWISIEKDGKPVPIKSVAKDGADLPLRQQEVIEKSARAYVGETADFNFTPLEPGIYEVKVRYMMARWTQIWEVSNNEIQ